LAPEAKRASPLQVARAVFWSFFGIRSGKEYDKDVAAITPVQAIVAGLIGAAIFVGTLILVVRHITS
jgi:hypothetical protein